MNRRSMASSRVTMGPRNRQRTFDFGIRSIERAKGIQGQERRTKEWRTRQPLGRLSVVRTRRIRPLADWLTGDKGKAIGALRGKSLT